MTFYNRNGEKKRLTNDFRRHEEEVVRSLCRLGSRPISPRSMQEEEKRIRREIANSNERRRMQSINAGFQYLRKLLPQREGEKLSKAAILQQTADFIYQLEQEKTCLLEQNCQLKRRVIDSQNNTDSDVSSSDSPFSKRRKRETGTLSDEGLGSSSPNDSSTDIKREVAELRLTLERERTMRVQLEEQIAKLETQLGSANVFDVALQDHASYHSTPEVGRKHRIINLVVDKNTLSSPHLATLKVESFHEVPPSPKLLPEEVPEDLSGKNNSPSHHYEKEVPMLNPTTLLHLSPLSSPPGFSMELEVSSQQEIYKPRSSRANLETIVEAIRHVEGDHMFRDDPSPSGSPVRRWSEDDATHELYDEQTYKTPLNHSLSLQHQIIRNAPVSQSRPGVIVSKLS